MFCGSVEPIYRTILRVLQNGSVEHIVQGFCARGVPVRVCVCVAAGRGGHYVWGYTFLLHHGRCRPYAATQTSLREAEGTCVQ